MRFRGYPFLGFVATLVFIGVVFLLSSPLPALGQPPPSPPPPPPPSYTVGDVTLNPSRLVVGGNSIFRLIWSTSGNLPECTTYGTPNSSLSQGLWVGSYVNPRGGERLLAIENNQGEGVYGFGMWCDWNGAIRGAQASVFLDKPVQPFISVDIPSMGIAGTENPPPVPPGTFVWVNYSARDGQQYPGAPGLPGVSADCLVSGPGINEHVNVLQDGGRYRGVTISSASTWTIICSDGFAQGSQDSITVNVSSRTQCSDDIDNDGDGKIDMVDPGCSSSGDDNEGDDPSHLECRSNACTRVSGSGVNQCASNADCIAPPPPLPSVDLKANGSNGPITIPSGSSADLSWTSTNATSCNASGDWSGSKNISGGSEPTGSLTSPKGYTLTCTGSEGEVSDSVTVNVPGGDPTPTVDLKANGSNGPITIPSGSSADLSWTSTNATSCNASGDWSGSKNISGGSQSTGSLNSNSLYSLTCTGSGGADSDSVTVNVSSEPVSHLECINNSCANVAGPGVNQCASNADCINPPPITHAECQSGSCVSVPGPGVNQCASSLECSGPPPPPPPPPQCSDGIDNDGDGLIDLSDPGCSGPSDNNEYNFRIREVIPDFFNLNWFKVNVASFLRVEALAK